MFKSKWIPLERIPEEECLDRGQIKHMLLYKEPYKILWKTFYKTEFMSLQGGMEEVNNWLFFLQKTGRIPYAVLETKIVLRFKEYEDDDNDDED